MIRLEGLTKRYREKVALENLDLTVEQGKFFVLLGPNGAGKTTTLKILAGLLRPTAGRVTIWGEDWTNPPAHARRQVTYIPDFPYLYDKLTPREFLEFIGAMYAMEACRLAEGIPFWLDAMEIREEQNRLIEQFSHGQKQRLVFAAALLPEPRVILVDEPMVGLDPHMRQKTARILKEKSRAGATIFMSTHTLSLAEEMADEIAVLDKARCVACGTLDQLRAQSRAGGAGGMEEIFFRLTEESGESR